MKSDMGPTQSGTTRVTGADRRTKGHWLFRYLSEQGTVCISSASTDLRGGGRVTGIPTAISYPGLGSMWLAP